MLMSTMLFSFQNPTQNYPTATSTGSFAINSQSFLRKIRKSLAKKNVHDNGYNQQQKGVSRFKSVIHTNVRFGENNREPCF